MKHYFHIWWLLSVASMSTATASYATVILFSFGKIFRFILFLGFILLLQFRTKSLGGYTTWEVILFFAVFNFIDTASQLFFREVYRFRQAITTGSFDFYLLRPFSPLFRSLLGGIDILDIPLLFVSLGFIFFSVGMNGHVSVIASILFFLLILNALVIAAAFHIFVLCIGILSTTVDQLLWIYRDLTIFGRVPIAVYQEPIRSLMTFIIPIGIMIAFPAEAVLGVLSPLAIIVAFLMSTILFLSSLLLWRYSLKQYTSASS
jgi:ABC-2 type transport system permease protein